MFYFVIVQVMLSLVLLHLIFLSGTATISVCIFYYVCSVTNTIQLQRVNSVSVEYSNTEHLVNFKSYFKDEIRWKWIGQKQLQDGTRNI